MQLGWIDFSKEERNKVLATLKMLGTQTALDELGIGVVRDAYADILFPGISTIQTRAKYFVLIPYIFAKAEKQSYSRSNEVLQWINNFEDKLVPVIVSNSDPKAIGIIGSDALRQKRTVKLKPTYIYWNGLRTFEIARNNKLSVSHACNIIMSKSKRLKTSSVKLDGETFDDQNANQGDFVMFSPILPDYDLEKETSIELTHREAVFILEKITKAMESKNTLLAFLLKKQISFNSFDEIDGNILPPQIKKDYQLGKCFADFIIGAHLRYNLIYSNYEDRDVLIDFEKWRASFDFNSFDLNAVFDRINYKGSIKIFCKAFLSHIKNNDMTAVDDLIISREKNVKGSRAKLKKPEEFRYSKVHNYKLDYRFGTARVIIDDIIRGLGDNNG
jgi:hypothetical protein